MRRPKRPSKAAAICRRRDSSRPRVSQARAPWRAAKTAAPRLPLRSAPHLGRREPGGKDSGSACGVACNLTCSNATDCNTEKPYYVAGNLYVEGTVYDGTLFVTGDVSLPNGLAGAGDNIETLLPRKAWMQYGLNAASRDHDATPSDNGYPGNAPWDPTAPATFPGLTSKKWPPGLTCP